MGRGQVSIEYLLVTSFSILLLAPVLVLFANQNTQVTDTFVQSQARQSAQAMSAAAERVYYAGPPSKETIDIRIPKNTQSVEITNSSIVFSITNPTRQDILVASEARLIPGSIDPRSGPVELSIEATNTGVRISEP